MRPNDNDIVCAMYERAAKEMTRLVQSQKEIEELSAAYFRYQSLMAEQSRLRVSIITNFGVMGKYFPEVTPKTKKLISKHELNSSSVRKGLRIWEVLKLYLETVDRPDSIGRFRSFLQFLDFDEIPTTPQAIDSAIKTHPELFAETKEGNDRLISIAPQT